MKLRGRVPVRSNSAMLRGGLASDLVAFGGPKRKTSNSNHCCRLSLCWWHVVLPGLHVPVFGLTSLFSSKVVSARL